MRRSLLLTCNPRETAVAATMRSGISGTSLRATRCMASTISIVNGTSSRTWFGSLRAFRRSVYAAIGRRVFFDEGNNFGQTDRRKSDLSPRYSSVIDEFSRGNRQLRIVKQVPDGCMGIGYSGNHRKASGKPRNISARLVSISSAEGAGPY